MGKLQGGRSVMAAALDTANAVTEQWASGGPIAVTKPPSMATGDWWFVFFGCDGIATGDGVTMPAGWTRLDTTQVTTTPDGSTYTAAYRVIDGSEGAAQSFTTSTGSGISYGTISLRGTGIDSVRSTGSNKDSASASPWSLAGDALAVQAGDLSVWSAYSDNSASAQNPTWTAPSGYTGLMRVRDPEVWGELGVAYKEISGSGTETPAGSCAFDSGTAGGGVINFVLIASAGGTASDQEGARFGNDDAAEAAHTWAAAQDTDITAPAGQTQVLNMIVNATGTLGAKTFKLQYRKVGDASWRDMPVQ